MSKKKDNKYIKMDDLFGLVPFYDEYVKESIYHAIDSDIIHGRKASKNFKKNDAGEILMNTQGAYRVIDDIGYNREEFKNIIEFINNNEPSDKEIKSTLNIQTHNKAGYDNNKVKRVVEECVLGIPTNGKSVDDILSNNNYRELDIDTINGTMSAFEKSCLDNASSCAIPLENAYKYVDEHDPEIVRRMMYNHKNDPIELGDYIERHNHMPNKNIRKAIKKDFAMARKKYKRNNNSKRKKNKNDNKKKKRK